MNIEQKVIEHYGPNGTVNHIFEALGKESGFTIEELAPYDEMHIGGRDATAHFAEKLGVEGNMHILDVGCGLGGAARFIADATGVRITGIDLTPEFIDTATILTQAAVIDTKPVFKVASAVDLPFEDDSFDGAYLIHVGMNIKDKAAVYKEVARVIKPGSVFGLYDVLGNQTDEGFRFPVPWAENEDTSFLISYDEISSLLQDAGFAIVESEDRRGFALEVFEKVRQMQDAGKGDKALPSIRKDNLSAKVQNLTGNIKNNLCGPWEIICRKL